MPDDYLDARELRRLGGPLVPLHGPSGPPPETVEVEGLLVTELPTGGLALMDSHADGATSMIMLQGRRLEALRALLDHGRGGDEARAAEESAEATAPAEAQADPAAEENPPEDDGPTAAPGTPAGEAPEEAPNAREPVPAEEVPVHPIGLSTAPEETHRTTAGPLASGPPTPDAGPPLVADWTAYDEELKAAFLLEQYAMGVMPDDLPPGWKEILEELPASLAARSRQMRMLFQRLEAGGRREARLDEPGWPGR